MSRAQVVKLILTDDLRGKGTEADPFYRAVQLFSLDGLLIAEYHSVDESKSLVTESIYRLS